MILRKNGSRRVAGSARPIEDLPHYPARVRGGVTMAADRSDGLERLMTAACNGRYGLRRVIEGPGRALERLAGCLPTDSCQISD